MNQLFEQFIFRKLRKNMNASGVQVQAQKKFPFDFHELAVIKPDLIIRSRLGRRIVADTKYKVGNTPDSTDLYQMLAYCRVLSVHHGVLITVGTEGAQRYKVCDDSTTIEVIPVDLAGSVANIENSIQNLTKSLLNGLETPLDRRV